MKLWNKTKILLNYEQMKKMGKSTKKWWKCKNKVRKRKKSKKQLKLYKTHFICN